MNAQQARLEARLDRLLKDGATARTADLIDLTKLLEDGYDLRALDTHLNEGNRD